ncbi:MAG TPA: hypothetical protein VFJ30_11590, partial [Phycisphaerae bacterium]|nr:hypothetical protein [Phycisphaerae bacterium]
MSTIVRCPHCSAPLADPPAEGAEATCPACGRPLTPPPTLEPISAPPVPLTPLDEGQLVTRGQAIPGLMVTFQGSPDQFIA